MRLLLIRHGDPNYATDSLTEKGVREATALSGIIPQLHVGDCYVSPLGRAKQTARLALKGTGIEPVQLGWLQEFMTDCDVNDSEELQRIFPDTPLLADMAAEAGADPAAYLERYRSLATHVDPRTRLRFGPDAEGHDRKYGPRIVWDMMPEYFTSHPELSHPTAWRNSFLAQNSGRLPRDPAHPEEKPQSILTACYDYVTEQFDAFLEGYGYHRTEGGLYRTKHGTEQTVTFFCHFGVIAVLLSHLWDTSPLLLQQSLCMAPSSVTEVVTEERAEGKARFRALRIGDTTHLTMDGQAPSFAARFCEAYSSAQRH